MSEFENTGGKFFHHLYDTIILLGGGREIASLVKKIDEINESDVDELRRFNASLIEATKDKLVALNQTKIRVFPSN